MVNAQESSNCLMTLLVVPAALTVIEGIPLRASGMAAPHQTRTRSPTWLRDADEPVDGDEHAPAAKASGGRCGRGRRPIAKYEISAPVSPCASRSAC